MKSVAKGRRSDPDELLEGRAFQELRDAILYGQYPPGMVVSEQLLAQSLGMSRTPIRRALVRLESIGLIAIIPNRGAVIQQLTPRDITEIFEFREAIETYALSRPPRVLDALLLRKLRVVFAHSPELVTPTTDLRVRAILSEADEQLHEGIVAMTSNRLLISHFESLRQRLVQVRVLSWSLSQPGAPHRGATVAAREHTEIIDAVLGGEYGRAQVLLREHLRAGREHLLNAAAQPPAAALVPFDPSSGASLRSWLHDDAIDIAALEAELDRLVLEPSVAPAVLRRGAARDVSRTHDGERP